MAQVEVENMEDNAALFMAKMGFPHNADGLDLSDDQLVMPVMKVKGGYRWGSKGKVYRTKAEAAKQGRAAYASGYGKKKKGK